VFCRVHGICRLSLLRQCFRCIYPCHQESIIIRSYIGSVGEVSDGIGPIIYATNLFGKQSALIQAEAIECH
jgi:hypothetical protein